MSFKVNRFGFYPPHYFRFARRQFGTRLCDQFSSPEGNLVPEEETANIAHIFNKPARWTIEIEASWESVWDVPVRENEDLVCVTETQTTTGSGTFKQTAYPLIATPDNEQFKIDGGQATAREPVIEEWLCSYFSHVGSIDVYNRPPPVTIEEVSEINDDILSWFLPAFIAIPTTGSEGLKSKAFIGYEYGVARQVGGSAFIRHTDEGTANFYWGREGWSFVEATTDFSNVAPSVGEIAAGVHCAGFVGYTPIRISDSQIADGDPQRPEGFSSRNCNFPSSLIDRTTTVTSIKWGVEFI